MRDPKELNQLEVANQYTVPRFSFLPNSHRKDHIMQLATLIVSCAALLVSSATLTVVLVGGMRMKNEVDAVKATADQKAQQLRQALMAL